MSYRACGRTKNFPVFDCDSHIYEPPEVWDKYIPENHRDFARTHFYRDADRLISVKNGKISFRDPNKWKYPGETWHPGLNKHLMGRYSQAPRNGMKKSAATAVRGTRWRGSKTWTPPASTR